MTYRPFFDVMHYFIKFGGILATSSIVFAGAHGQIPSEVRILKPGDYHGEEVQHSDSLEIWFGLYTNGLSGAELRPTPVRFEAIHDGIVDKAGEQTGVRVAVQAADSLIVLLSHSASPYLDTLIVPSYAQMAVLVCGDSLDFTAPTSSPEMLVAPDGLIQLASQGIHQPLYECFGPSTEKDGYLEAYTVLHWAGDLDGDGKVDLLFHHQDHYNKRLNLSLFLSSHAEEGSLVKEVASFLAVGC